MYSFNKMTDKQRRETVEKRRKLNLPLHSPPHFADGRKTYFLTGANFRHKRIMNSSARREEMQAKLLEGVGETAGAEIFAWCILPNHWHLLTRCDLTVVEPVIGRLHNGLSTQWNREDGTPGRKVWHRFCDRGIRNDAHYLATLNYIHANPVRHGCAGKSDRWKHSSVHLYLENLGREKMIRIWNEYPVGDYGKGWDW